MTSHNHQMRITTEFASLATGAFKRLTGMLKQTSKQPRCLRFILPDGQSIDSVSRIYVMLGRSDAAESKDPVDVDFANANAAELGVSHEHAVIQVVNGHVYIKDFNSRNGTYLNGMELYAMREYPLADGDEIMLGRLAVRVQFIY
jgi:hypothetical protein